MTAYIMKGKELICTIVNATMMPRVGETMVFEGYGRFTVKEVIWHIRNNSENFIQIKVQ